MPILEAFLLLPEFAAAGEAALGVEAALAAGAVGAGAAGLFGAEALGAAAGAEALGTAGVAAAVPEAAMGINAINPELFASAVNSGAVNPATAFNDIPALADKLANLPAGPNLFDTNALAEANNFGAGQMANRGIMAADPYLPAGQDLYRPDLVAEANRFGASQYANQGSMAANPNAQITASNTSRPMAANPLPAAGSVPPAATPFDPANFGSYVETTGSPDSRFFSAPPPTEPPGFFDKLSDTFSPLQKGFEKAQEFAKKNPLMTGIASTIASRMANSGNSAPDTTYNGPLSKFKLSKNFKGNYVNPEDYRYKRASGGIIDYKEGGTTEPLAHADMGIAIDDNPQTNKLSPLAAAKKRAKQLRDYYGISIPEMQAPTPIDEINVGPRTAAHGGIMQVKRFEYGGDTGFGGGFDGSGTDGSSGFDGSAGYDAGGPDAGPDSGTDAGAGLTGSSPPSGFADQNAGESSSLGTYYGGQFGAGPAPNLGANPLNADVGLNYGEGVGGAKGTGVGGYASPGNGGGSLTPGGSGGGGGGGGDSGGGGDTTTPIKTPITNIDDLKPQFVNPEMYRPVTNPLAHYAKYDNEDYNYLRTPSMAVRSSPFNTPPSNTNMANVFTDLMYKSSTSGVNTSEFDKYGGYAKVKTAAEAAGYSATPEFIQSYEIANNLPESAYTKLNKQFIKKNVGGDINSYAQGGMSSLGGYARGGMPRLLDGPGDGMSDNIPATINDRQPARLADGEFVVPADVVSHLGNGSTKAGSKRLHLMMDQVRQARTGNPKQGKRINPDKFMPR